MQWSVCFPNQGRIVLSAQAWRTRSASVCWYSPSCTKQTLPHASLHHHKYFPVAGTESISWAAWVMPHHWWSLFTAMDIQWKEMIIKWQLFCWHICGGFRQSMLPTGSYDDDDILTKAPRDTPSSIAFCRARGKGFLLWGFVGGNLDRVDDACGPLGWEWMRTFGCQWWGGLSGSVTRPQGNEKTQGAWSQ